jgi:uncharacterized protein
MNATTGSSRPLTPLARIRRVIEFVIVAYALWLIAIFVMQRSILFPRSLANGRFAPPPAAIEVWREPRPDGIDAIAWFLESRDDDDAPKTRRAAVVLVHGNAMIAGDWLAWAESIAERGAHVLLPEYRGYGDAAGSPSRDALVGDLQAMLARLRADPRVNPEAILVYGRSIGGTIAAEAAVANSGAEVATPPSHLILHTAPARIRDYSWRFGVPPFLVRDPFDAIAALTELRGRTTITIFGHDRDEVVPARDAERLATAAGVETISFRGTHNAFGDRREQLRFEELMRWAVDDAIARAAGVPQGADEPRN